MFYSHLFSTCLLQNARPEGSVVLEGTTPVGSGSAGVATLQCVLAPANTVHTPNLRHFTLILSECALLDPPWGPPFYRENTCFLNTDLYKHLVKALLLLKTSSETLTFSAMSRFFTCFWGLWRPKPRAKHTFPED